MLLPCIVNEEWALTNLQVTLHIRHHPTNGVANLQPSISGTTLHIRHHPTKGVGTYYNPPPGGSVAGLL